MADNNPPRRQPSRRAKKEDEEEAKKKPKTTTTTSSSTSTTRGTTAGKPTTTRTTSSRSGSVSSTTSSTSATSRRKASNAGAEGSGEATSTTTASVRSNSTRGGASSTTTTRRTTSTSSTTSASSSTGRREAAGSGSTATARRTTSTSTGGPTRSTSGTTSRTSSSGRVTATSASTAAKTRTSAATASTTRAKPTSTSTTAAPKGSIEYNMTVDSTAPAKSAEQSAEPPTKDVEMETVKETEEAPAVVEVDPVEEALKLVVSDITQNFHLLQKAVATIEARYSIRVIRTLVSIRRRMSAEALMRAIKLYTPQGGELSDKLIGYLQKASTDSMEVDKPASTAAVTTTTEQVIASLPEIDMYLSLLVLIWLIDQQQLEQAIELAQHLVAQIAQLNRRTLDQIAARVFFYYARVHELTNQSATIRPQLLAVHRTADLRHDDESQATLINLLLRNYFQHKLYDQADHLVTKTAFPDSASNNQLARYLYYLGRIKALQLDYTESHKHLTTAIRKAPQTTAAAGFLQAVYKFSIIVQLLMGEIPERSIFRQPMLRKALLPYFHLTQAVRVGDLTKFQETLAKHEAVFQADSTYTLILRLRHNVIKTGVRMINLSYSRISLRDICIKLHLDSEESAEYIVAKAIRDGVIDATIDHKHGYIQSKENADIYSTTEPQHAFDQRISYCLALHDESIKAMRYPSKVKPKGEEEPDEEGGEPRTDLAGLIMEDLDELDDDDMLDDF